MPTSSASGKPKLRLGCVTVGKRTLVAPFLKASLQWTEDIRLMDQASLKILLACPADAVRLAP